MKSGLLSSNKPEDDYIVGKFQEVISKTDDLSFKLSQHAQDVDSLSQSLELVKESHANLACHHDKYRFSINEATKLSAARCDSFSSAIVNLGLENEKKGNALNSLYKDGAVFRERLEKHDIWLGGLTYQTDFNDLKKQVNNLATNREQIASDIDQNSLGLRLLKSAHDKQKDLFDSQLADHAKILVASNNNSVDVFKEIKDLRLKMSDAIAQLDAKWVGLVESKIAAIPKPVIPSLDDAKIVMQAQIEPISLDAKNAHLRSENSEKRVFLLEKKVEQLQLILNKLQLQG